MTTLGILDYRFFILQKKTTNTVDLALYITSDFYVCLCLTSRLHSHVILSMVVYAAIVQ